MPLHYLPLHVVALFKMRDALVGAVSYCESLDEREHFLPIPFFSTDCDDAAWDPLS